MGGEVEVADGGANNRVVNEAQAEVRLCELLRAQLQVDGMLDASILVCKP